MVSPCITLRTARLAAALFFCLFAAKTASAQRLSGTVVPEHYDLAFDVDLARARFTSTESIRVRLTEASRRIVLHALDITFDQVTIEAGGTSQTASVALNGPTQTAALTVPRNVPAGAATLHIKYTGILNDKLRGFYLSKANGRSYAVTQFESTDARRAFPGFDEPAFKATFSIALTIDAADTAISNGTLLTDTPGPGAGRHTLTFSESPKMSSYLVAMAVGDFQCLEDASAAVPIRICATPDKKELGHIALDASRRILDFYNSYYSIPYPFKKLDVVAVPDFAAGAMENTAAIFYREVDLLADSKTASVGNNKRIWGVLAHEMAHQWFGDLVTMKWWDDLWLNEGFATWMEKRPLAALRPEWKMELDEVADTNAAMNLDALASTHAIHSTVETPDEIEGSFDTIAYEKGGSVMRMIEGYLGADAFRRGVNAYLEKHAYGNATSQDFWAAVAASSGQPVDRILPTFVNQPGVPLVDVSLKCASGRSELALTVQRYFVDPAMARTVRGSPAWEIPICVKFPGRATATCQVISGANATVALNTPQCPAWAFINGGAQGYFRTRYPSSMLQAMSADLESQLTAPERMLLASDEWSLVRAGRHTVADYLTLTAGLKSERTSGVIGEVADRLEAIHDYIAAPASRPAVEAFVRRLMDPIFAEVGVDGPPDEPDDRRQLRATVIGALGDAGNDPAVASAATTALARTLEGGAPLNASAGSAIIAVAARRGDAALWERLLKAANDAASPAEHYRYLYGLTAFENPALIDRSLNLTLSPDLRSQDTPGFLSRMLSNQSARERTWSFIKQHWTELQPKVTISLGDVTLVQGLSTMCDPTSRDDVKAFFTAHPLPAASRTLDQTLERINNCAAISQQQRPALDTWLASSTR